MYTTVTVLGQDEAGNPLEICFHPEDIVAIKRHGNKMVLWLEHGVPPVITEFNYAQWVELKKAQESRRNKWAR